MIEEVVVVPCSVVLSKDNIKDGLTFGVIESYISPGRTPSCGHVVIGFSLLRWLVGSLNVSSNDMVCEIL